MYGKGEFGDFLGHIKLILCFAKWQENANAQSGLFTLKTEMRRSIYRNPKIFVQKGDFKLIFCIFLYLH